MQNQRQRSNSQRGAAVVEMGLCFLLVFAIVYSIIEYGRFIYSYNILAGATREAARYAIVHGSRSGAPATQADIRAQLVRWGVGLDPSSLNVNTTWIPGNTPGSIVRIEASYVLNPMTGLIVNAPITVRSRSEMLVSQ